MTLHQKNDSNTSSSIPIYRLLIILGAFIAFLIALELLSFVFESLGEEYVQGLLQATHNPFVAFFIGLLAAAILQSSSTITSIMVAIIAGNTLMSFTEAIPIIMGANIGTTLTSTLVSLGYIDKPNLFRRGVTVASIHGFFNIFTAFALLPLEYSTQLLSRLSHWTAKIFLKIDFLEKSFSDNLMISQFILEWIDTTNVFHIFLIGAVAFILLFLSLKIISEQSKTWLSISENGFFNFTLFANRQRSFLFGFLLTSLIQSSSITSSIIVPLYANGRVKLTKCFFYIMGLNIGTTLTAFIAAFSVGSPFALTLAIAHILFNLIGVALFLIPFVFKLGMWYGKKIGILVDRNRSFIFLYLITLFFLIPFLLILSSQT
ncbi:Na/Pi symporter [Algivirga pacifica]|uniref:Na/Pi cotransporter family protein n=1 Tax=Algivirga pacifica TaxID=1162670 RepID=A0ABP9DG48_9BACT